MGTLASTLTQIGSTVGTINTIASSVKNIAGYKSPGDAMRLQQEHAMRQLQQNQAQKQAEAQRDMQAERDKITLAARQDAETRRRALKRAMAKQNASRGASGASASGSGEAVLLGLYNESEEEAKQRESLDKLRYNALDNDLYTLSERNILEKQQLSERQRLQRAVSRY